MQAMEFGIKQWCMDGGTLGGIGLDDAQGGFYLIDLSDKGEGPGGGAQADLGCLVELAPGVAPAAGGEIDAFLARSPRLLPGTGIGQ